MPAIRANKGKPSRRRIPRKLGGMCLGLFFVMLLVSAGCVASKTIKPVPGPLTLDQVMARYTGRIHAIPTFQAKIKEWEVFYKTEPDKTIHHKDMYGHVVFRPAPASTSYASCYLEARTLLDPEMIMGCNSHEYWIAVKRAEQAYWGKYEYLNKPCSEAMPFHPQLFLELAGLRPILSMDDSTGRLMLKVYPEQNIVEYLKEDEYGMWVYKEVVFDRRTDFPSAVNIYDHTGKRTIESRIEHYQKLNDIPLPSELSLTAEDGDFRFRLRLGNFKIPKNDRSQLFIRPQRIAGINQFQQIDEPCEHDTP